MSDNLFNIQESKYGPMYKDHLLEQYKLYVDSADKISDRRQKNNDFFLTVNTALLGFLGYISSQNDIDFIMIILLSVVGILIGYSWYRLIRSYKNINSGKFKVIHNIEAKLPLGLYDFEWTKLGRGKDKKLYQPFTKVELRIPWIFIVLYICVIAFNFF